MFEREKKGEIRGNEMKIKTKKRAYEEVISLPKSKHKKPVRPNGILKGLMKVLSAPELKKTHFSYEMIGMAKLKKDEPCLILMNHSSFIDLKIAAKIFSDRPYNIVCTSDGFVGKEALMRHIGCIPTQKFVMDITLLKDMVYTVKTLKSSVLLFPEASYSFDGTATPLPSSVAKCVKMLKVPVIMIRTYGAFARDPLYNNLQVRDVDVSATVTYLLSPQEIEEKSTRQIQTLIDEQFNFDHFRWQQERHIKITESFRADHLNRVLYKCPHCLSESKMIGKGSLLTCHACHKSYELTEEGSIVAKEGQTEFAHIPDWYRWERECVRDELLAGTYLLDLPVSICMMVDTKAIYEVGEGRLVHDKEGFHLTGCDGKLDYKQKPQASYSLYADYYWYEIGDMICIGDHDTLYYCFPLNGEDVAAKTRLATEELYKLTVGIKKKGVAVNN